jgi:hypothetical protein
MVRLLPGRFRAALIFQGAPVNLLNQLREIFNHHRQDEPDHAVTSLRSRISRIESRLAEAMAKDRETLRLGLERRCR